MNNSGRVIFLELGSGWYLREHLQSYIQFFSLFTNTNALDKMSLQGAKKILCFAQNRLFHLI